jgi:glycosyltransferase involved in cell wall biosynthesis
LNVGFVVTELIDGRFAPWEASLEWESYLDLYCLALARMGHSCVKYVPSISTSSTQTYRHRFGHTVKRIPVYNRLLSPRPLLRARAYQGGYTTIFRELLAPTFALNLLKEAVRDEIDILHYASYYSAFFVPAFLLSGRFVTVAQYTGGALPPNQPARALWASAILPSLSSSAAVLLGDYASERACLTRELKVPIDKQEYFSAPIIDTTIFEELDKATCQRRQGFDPKKRNILAVTSIPSRSSGSLGKDPFLMLDVLEEALRDDLHPTVLYIAGSGPGEEQLKLHVMDRGLGERVRILGRVEHRELPRYYGACDLVFFPQRIEKLNEGSVTIEAFACSRPVVAFKRHQDDPTEQLGGFLVDTAPERGGPAIMERLNRQDYLSEKGAEGKTLASGFSLEVAGRRLEDIYSKVLA